MSAHTQELERRGFNIVVALLILTDVVFGGFALFIFFPGAFIGLVNFAGTTLAGNIILLVIAILTATGGLNFFLNGFTDRSLNLDL